MPTSIPAAPAALPLLGHTLPPLRNPLSFLLSLPARGDLVRIRIGPATAVVACTAELTHEILCDDRIFDKGGIFFDRFREMLGDGLSTCPRSQHRRQRRLLQPAFHTQRLPGYAQTMTTQVAATVGRWQNGQIIDVPAEMMAITGRTLLTTMFSNSLPSPALRQALDDLTAIFAVLYWRMLTPPPLDRLPTVDNRRYHRASTRLRHTIGSAVAGRRAAGVDRGDLLSAILASHEVDSSTVAFTDTEVIDQIVSFFIAGTETTALTVAWALYLLAEHPAIEQRVHAEIDPVLAGRAATHADLPRLGLVNRIVTETLRLYPPGWIISRVATADVYLGGHRIPAGATVIFSPYLIHHRPDLYAEPDRFDPDRWLPERARAIGRNTYIPFGGGTRKCIGDNFGTTEAALALATIAANWRMQRLPGLPVRPAVAASLRPRNLALRVTARTADRTPGEPGRRLTSHEIG
ncbi:MULTISPECIES: cytochrome P450 [Mycobacterium]|uniref:Cytochrome P450 n=1 Tax=Mycobacterium pseudoshottsii TaxID=265949 RepID=A0A9N7QQM4_9MYCO|nr:MULTISPECIES: cytochrome P450 [Mycobacterium]BBA90564.1 cytochrome P450 [Mycobacterium pseudoshottsii JCM 15466]BDN85055.1 cytochrome P450 [Mycobacterium pseudoshottsii]BEH79427.1 cytochrome P450 [Mycobacterium pseudoshottsii]